MAWRECGYLCFCWLKRKPSAFGKNYTGIARYLHLDRAGLFLSFQSRQETEKEKKKKTQTYKCVSSMSVETIWHPGYGISRYTIQINLWPWLSCKIYLLCISLFLNLLNCTPDLGFMLQTLGLCFIWKAIWWREAPAAFKERNRKRAMLFFKGWGDYNHPKWDVIHNYSGMTGTNWDCPMKTGVFGHPSNKRISSFKWGRKPTGEGRHIS